MFDEIKTNEVTDKMTKEVENIEETTDLQTPDETAVAESKAKPTEVESQFDILETTKDGKITVLNVYGGCIVNTYFKNVVSSVYVPGNHLINGQIVKM